MIDPKAAIVLSAAHGMDQIAYADAISGWQQHESEDPSGDWPSRSSAVVGPVAWSCFYTSHFIIRRPAFGRS